MQTENTDTNLEQLAGCLDGGPDAALSWLNARVLHRFTGIWQLRHGMLHCLYLHDKLDALNAQHIAEVPLEESFCQLTLHGEGVGTSDAGSDPRFQNSKYRQHITSYFGFPLQAEQGQFFGVLCHLDVASYAISDAEFAFLQNAAKLFTSHLGVLACKQEA